jgi:hypothetical protein
MLEGQDARKLGGYKARKLAGQDNIRPGCWKAEMLV